jgi:hypothetical protein
MTSFIPAPPTIVIDTPNSTPSAPPTAPPAQQHNPTAKPSTSKRLPPSIDTVPVPSPTATATGASPSIFTRSNATATTPAGEAACYLCDEQNPGDFSPTTKFLEPCLLCARWFCPIHKSQAFDGVCDINHSTYFHKMLGEAARILKAQADATGTKSKDTMSPGAAAKVLDSRDIAEILIGEGIYPSLGEREKAIFATSPVDERKQRELESFRSLDAAVMNGGERGRREAVEERDVVGADVAV